MIRGHQLIPRRQRKGADSALLFVHGFTGDSVKTWEEFPLLLGTEENLGRWDIFSLGYNTSFLPGTRGIWAADPEIPILATHFRTQLNIVPLSTYSNLAIAAHSMGGLVVQRALVDDPAVSGRLRQLFLFGTPSGGLKKAAFLEKLLGIFVGSQVRNMSANSGFITDLRKRWGASFGADFPFKLFAIAGDRDQFVPPESSLAPFPARYHRVVLGDHLSMVKPQDRDSESVRLILSSLQGMPEPATPSLPLRLAAEMGTSAPSGATVANAAASGQKRFTTERELVQAALVLDAEGKRAEAIELLEMHPHLGTDAKGTLAGRVKRRWLESGSSSDAKWALELYTEALGVATDRKNDGQIFYHAINVAFMKFVAFDESIESVKEMAALALAHAQKCERDPEQTVWSLATQAEAHLYLGNRNGALHLYQRVPHTQGAEHWQLLSAGQQAQLVAGKLKDTELQAELQGIFDQKPPTRKCIFISYSHRDEAYLTELQLMLKPLLTEWDKLELWADTQIKPGSKWREEIQRGLDSAKVAVLLVSADFLASDFVTTDELPVLFKAANNRELQILWMYLSPAAYEVTPIAQYQAAHDITRPLESLSKVERREVLKAVAFKIKEAIFA